MKKTFSFTILLLSILTSCEKKVEIPKKSKIIAKYVVFEDNISRKIVKNLKAVKEFDKSDNNDKEPFKLENKIYKIERDFRLDSGKLKILNEHIYHSFNYADFGLKKIEINRETIGQTTLIKFSKSFGEVVDGKDTLEIEEIFPEKKLFFVKEKRIDGRKSIYEYK